MCGSETLTTVVSSTSMKVLDMTAIAIGQGLISLVAESLAAITLALETRLNHAQWDLDCLTARTQQLCPVIRIVNART